MKRNLLAAVPHRLRHRLFTRNWPGGLTRRDIGSDEGATLVETAIATAIVLMLLFAVFDFSLAFYTYHYVSDAAREGSRWAMVRGSKSCSDTPGLTDCGATADKISSYVKSLSYPGIDSSNMTVNVSTAEATNSTNSDGSTTTVWSTTSNDMTYNVPGDQVTVQVSYKFPLSIPFWSITTAHISSTSSMVISQ